MANARDLVNRLEKENNNKNRTTAKSLVDRLNAETNAAGKTSAAPAPSNVLASNTFLSDMQQRNLDNSIRLGQQNRLNSSLVNAAYQANASKPNNTDLSMEYKMSNYNPEVLKKLTGNDTVTQKQQNRQTANDYMNMLKEKNPDAYDYLSGGKSKKDEATNVLKGITQSMADFGNSNANKNLFWAASGLVQKATNAINDSTQSIESQTYRDLIDKYGMSEEEAAYWDRNYGTISGIIDAEAAENRRKEYEANYSDEVKQAINEYVAAEFDKQVNYQDSNFISRMSYKDRTPELEKKLLDMGINIKDKGEYQQLYEYLYQDYSDSNARDTEIEVQRDMENNPASIWGYNIADVIGSPMGGIYSMVGNAINNATKMDKTQPSNVNGAWGVGQNMSEYIQAGTNSQIEQMANKYGYDPKYGQFAYGVGSSTAKSLYSMWLGGSVAETVAPVISSELGLTGKAAEKVGSVVAQLTTLPSFGASAYSSTLKQQLDMGMGEQQAQSYAVISGINEMLFEELSLDKAYGVYTANAAGKVAARKSIMDIFAQAGIEGSEEVFTELSNRWADAIINTDFSQHNIKVRDYVNAGYTEEQAEAMVKKEEEQQLLETFLAGAASGGITGIVSTVAGKAKYRSTAQNILNDSAKTQAFVDEVKASAPEGSTAREIIDKAGDNKLSVQQVADILQSLDEVDDSEMTAEDVVTNAFIRTGETAEQARQDAQLVLDVTNADVMNEDQMQRKLSNGQQLTDDDVQRIARFNQNADKVEDAMKSNPNFENVYGDYLAGNIQAPSTIAQAAQQVAKQERAQERAEKLGEAFDKVTQPIRNITNKINEGKMQRNAVFQAEHDGNTVEVIGVDSVKPNGKIMLNTSEGRMDIADLNVDNKQEAVRVLNIIATTENAKAINYALKNFDANFSYASAVLGKQAFHMGQNGVSIDKLLNGNDKSTINALALLRNSDPTDAYLKAMYDIGVNSQEKREVKNVDKDKYETIKAAKKDGFDVAENDELRDFKKAVKDFGGFNFITDYGETRFNGSWMVELATMTSSNGTNEFAAITHEMMEFAESLAPEAYKKLSDSVMNLAVEQLGWSEVNDIIKKYQEAYRKSGLKGTANKTYEQAKDEFINDFMSGAFSTEEGAKQFIEHITNSDEYSASDKVSILESFAEWVDHLLDTIKNFLTKPQQLGGEVAMKLEKAGNDLTEIRKLAFEALDEAKAELQRQLNTEMSNIVKADIKENAVPEETEFSLKMPIEQTDKLVALHNLNEENLLRTLKLGGFAMPSIAVTKSDMLHENFGNITALFDKSVVQPNQVYSGDAYTPMFPHIDYQVDRDKLYELEKEIKANMDNVPDDFKNDVNKIISRLEQDVEVNGFAGAVESMSRDYGMIQYYLGLQNKAVQTIKTQTVKELTDFQIENAEEIIKRVPNIKEVSMFGREAADKYGEAVKDAWRYLLEKDGYTEKEISDIVDSFDPAYIKKELINAKNYAIKGARQVTETEDYTATRKAILDAVDKDEFKSWLIDKLDGIEARAGIRNNKDTFTPSGKRRSFEQLHEEITLENVVKSMLQEKEKGGAALFSVNSIFGASTRAFKSIAEMKKEMGRLQKITDDEIKEARSGFISRLTEIGERMIHSGMTVSGAIDAINDAVAASKTKAQLVREMNLNKQWYNVDDEIIEDVWNLVGDIAKMPTTYFEAKPRRAVGFDEIEKLLVPDNASKKLFTELDSRNIPYSIYEHGNNDDRLAKLNQAVEETGADFSISVTTDGRKVAVLDTDILNGVSEDDWKKTVSDYLKAHNSIIVRSGVIKLNSKDIKEYLRSKDASKTERKTPAIYLDKLKAASILSDIANVSTDYVNEESKHKHYKYFARGKALLKIGNNGYSAEVVIGINANFDMHFYDLVKITPENFDIKNELNQTANGNNQMQRLDSTLNQSVSNLDNNVNLSLNVDAAGNKLSEQQVKFFENSVVRDAEGRLVPMYHGTPNGDFEVFNAGSYFSDMKWYADEYQSQGASMLGYKKTATNPKTYAVYLNITKPFDTRNAAERKIFEEQFYRKWGTGSPLTERGLIDWTDVEDMKEFIEDNDLDYDGIIADEGGVPDGNGGVKSRGFSYIPMNGKQQVKSISNTNPTEDERIDYSINVDSDGNYGYHAGDLGKAEAYANQSYSRGTGHFGTGTYFVGDIEKIKNYNKRNGVESPKEIVDFSKYNLYNPRTYNDGMRLHEALKVLDGNIIKKDWIARAANDNYTLYNGYGYLDLLREKYGEVYDDDLGFTVMNPEAHEGTNYVDTMKEYADSIGAKYDSFEEWKNNLDEYDAELYSEDDTFEYNYEDYLKDVIKDYADEQNKMYHKFYEAYNDLHWTAAYNKDINKALMETADYVESIKNRQGSWSTADSVATKFMKALGYEGVDVRGIDGLDNTAYGSVIYDLKGEDLARKQEIGTARFSIDVGAENFNAAIDEMETNINGGVARLANNLSQLMDFKSDLSKRMVSKVASNLKKSFGSDMNTKELETKIMHIFNYLRETGSVSPEDIELIRTTIGEPLVDAIKDYDPAKADEYDKFVAGVKTWDIALNDEQMQEVRNKFDSYYGFKRYMSGKLNLNKNGTLLDDIWTEICDLSGGALSYGTNPNNQPLALAEYINSLEPKARMLDEESYESASMKAALEVFREFFVETANKDAAAKMRDEITEYNKAVKDRYKKLYNEALKEVEAAKAIELERLYKEYENLTIEQQQAINEGFDGLETVQIQQLKEDYKQRIQKLKEQDAEKLAKVKADYKNKQLKDRENKAWIEAKHKLVKEVTALQNMLAHPKEAATKHVPKQLVDATIDLLNALQMDNGRNKAVTERLAKLAETYAALKSDVKNDDGVNYGFDYDERIAADIEEIKQIFAGGKFYTDLYTPEIERIIEIVQALKTQIKNANNLIINGQIEDARNVAAGAMDEVLSSRFHSNKVSDALNVYSMQHLNAYREFRKLGGYTDGQFMRLYDDIEQASLKEMQIQKELGNIYSEVLKNNKEMKRFISTKADDLVDIGIKDENGKPVMVSRAMRMSIIMHSFNEGNMRHIIFGGMTVPNMEYLNKDKQSAYGRFGKIYRFLDYQKYLEAVAKKDRAAQNKMLTEARTKINSLVNDLSEWEQKFLEAAKTMFHEKTGEYINDTSVTLKGYTIARVKNYFPINTNKRFVPTDFAGLIMNGTIEGMGMLKERVQSSKPIMLEDITDVIQRSIKNTAKYAAYAIPMRNINMAMKQTFRDNRGEMTTLEQRIDEVWGKNDIKYLQNFITDIQNGRSGNESFKLMNKLRGNFAGAVLSLNPSVAIKQAASYPTAAAVLGYGPLARASVDIVKGSFFRQGIEELEKRNPLLWYRNQGYATQDMADAKAAGFGKNLPLWMQKAIGWTQFMDSGTVKTLQYASKYYVDSHYKNLKQGSNAYWDKVSEVFTQVVTETQPNYDTVHKADVIRDPNQFKKMLVMFKTQPMQNFGIIYDSLGELNANVIRYNQDKSSANKAKLNASIKKFAQSVSSQLMSALTFSAMTILANLLLHRWNKYRDDDDKWSWLRFFTAFGEGALSSLTGMLLGGSIVYELIKYAVNRTYLKNSDSDSAFHNVIEEWAGGNTRFSGVEVSTVETINDLVTNVAALTTNATGIWNAKTGAEREAAVQKTTNSLTKVVGSVGEFTGIPVNNLKNLFGSIAMYIMDAANGNGISSQSNIAEWEVSTQYERMYQALQDNDINAYNDLLNEQLAAYPDKDISDVNTAIRKIIKDDYLSGEIGKDETIDYLEAAGWDESTSELKMHQWETGTSSDYENLNNLIGTAADDPNADNRKALVAEVDWLLSQGKKKDKIRDSLKRKYAETYKKEYDTGDVTNLNSVLRQALTAAGYTDSEAADILKKWLN